MSQSANPSSYNSKGRAYHEYCLTRYQALDYGYDLQMGYVERERSKYLQGINSFPLKEKELDIDLFRSNVTAMLRAPKEVFPLESSFANAPMCPWRRGNTT